MLDVLGFTAIIKKLRLANQLHSRLELEHVTFKKIGELRFKQHLLMVVFTTTK